MCQVMNAREKKIQLDDCTKLTDHLLVVLPKLLSKVFIPFKCNRQYISQHSDLRAAQLDSGLYVMIRCCCFCSFQVVVTLLPP